MRRLALLIALVALVVAIPATHTVFAKAVKVDVCHLNSANQAAVISYDYQYDYVYPAYGYDYHYNYSYSYTYQMGMVISVDENAVDAHVAHGDSVYFNELTEYWANFFQNLDDYYTDYEYEYEDANYYYYYSSDYNNTNAVVKNADCWFYSAE